MAKWLAVIAVAIFLFLQASFTWGEFDQTKPDTTGNEQLAGFVRLWSETKYSFASFDKVPEVDWDRVLVDYLPQFAQPQDAHQYYRLLQRCLAQLHDGHTRVDVEVCAGQGDDRPPLLVKPIQGRAVVTEIADAPELAAQSIKVGCEIVKVDGREVKDILEKDVYPYISASTPQMRDGFSYERILIGPRGSKASVAIRDANGSERTVTMTRNGSSFQTRWTAPKKDFEYRQLDDGLAYVALRSFNSPGVGREFDGVFDKIRTSKGLIIDVRENTGGNTLNGYAVISRLIDEPLQGSKWRSPQYVPAFKSWGREQKWYEGETSTVQPAKGRPSFLGPVVVLTSAATGSAAEDFLIPLHYAHRAKLVGERTAGSTGNPLVVHLPGDVIALICTKHDTYPDGKEFVGVGVIPDVELQPTLEDVTSGRDVILEKGIEVAKSMVSSAPAPR